MTLTSQRVAYGEELLAICKENDKVVVMDADLCGATQTSIVEKGRPASFIEMGIGEANMVGAAAGLALSGRIPVVNSFAVFAAGRAFEQIRQSVCLPDLHVIIMGASAGMSDFADGATHQAVEDVAIMRVLPHMTVFSPSDALEARRAIRAAVGHKGPCYLRVHRSDLPDITTPETPLVIGEPSLMADGKDVAICASGYMVAVALEARKILKDRGVDAKVLNFATIKPLKAAAVRKAIGSARRIVTVEEHSVIGGLGSAILECLAENPISLRRHGIMDTFGESSEKYEKLIAKYGLTAEKLVETVMAK